MMKRYAGAVLIAAAAWALGAGMARSQELGSLYGSRNLQYINLRYAPTMLPYQGQGGEMMFGFNTQSKKTNRTDYKYFYGVALGGGGAWWNEADLGTYGERDAANGYILFQLENKFFPTVKGSVLPYIGGSVSYGTGMLWTEDLGMEDEPTGGFDLYGAGLEAGVMTMINKDYALTVAAGMDARSYRIGSEMKGVYPVMVTVGICRWRGSMK